LGHQRLALTDLPRTTPGSPALRSPSSPRSPIAAVRRTFPHRRSLVVS
jgi:hypothetical protein